SAVAAGVLLVATDASSADKTAVAVVRGPAILKTTNLSYTSGMNAGQKTTALAQLAALGITARTDYGV
ncbi:MAG TPA: head decoration protein, partial [Sphingomicrobium sp.]|nr:head decoration protein [Sphingomicrobium sp.]